MRRYLLVSKLHMSSVFQEGQYLVTAYGRMPLFCKADGHRWPSAATPSKYTFPNKVLTEDDVLHVRNLPNFDDVMGARALRHLEAEHVY